MHTIYIYCIMMDKVILNGKKQKVLFQTIKIRKILFPKYTYVFCTGVTQEYQLLLFYNINIQLIK